MSDKTLVLVDGSSYLYRAFHALPDLRGPGGFPTGAIHGVVAMMKKLRDDYPSLHGACVFDDKGTTYRKLILDKYPELDINFVHHAGNSSGVVDGSAAILLASPSYAKAHGLKPRARVVKNLKASP